MLKETLLKSMKTAISNVMETMFFQSVKINDSHQVSRDWFPEGQSLLGARLCFTGPLSGSCYILIPYLNVREMTGDFLGITQEKINQDQVKDTVKETLNMIGGNMLSVSDKVNAFKLGIPEIMDRDDILSKKIEGEKGHILLVETNGKRLALGLIVNG